MNSKLYLFASVVCVFLATSCATHKNWVPIGGSRADATVRLSYSYGGFEIPKTNPQEALMLAQQRCRAWGYDDAEAFGGEFTSCNRADIYGNCVSMTVVKDFQCITYDNTPPPIK